MFTHCHIIQECQDDILPLLSSSLSYLAILVHSPQFTVLSVTCFVEGATVFLCFKGLQLLPSKLKHLLYIFDMFSGLKTFPFMLLFCCCLLTLFFVIVFVVVIVQLLSHAWLFVTPWTVALQASLSSITSQSLLRFMSIESVMLSNHFILCCPLLLLPSVFTNKNDLHDWIIMMVWPLI